MLLLLLLCSLFGSVRLHSVWLLKGVSFSLCVYSLVFAYAQHTDRIVSVFHIDFNDVVNLVICHMASTWRSKTLQQNVLTVCLCLSESFHSSFCLCLSCGTHFQRNRQAFESQWIWPFLSLTTEYTIDLDVNIMM